MACKALDNLATNTLYIPFAPFQYSDLQKGYIPENNGARSGYPLAQQVSVGCAFRVVCSEGRSGANLGWDGMRCFVSNRNMENVMWCLIRLELTHCNTHPLHLTGPMISLHSGNFVYFKLFYFTLSVILQVHSCTASTWIPLNDSLLCIYLEFSLV